MLRIQVLGSGLIPRGHGIAPKKEPFPADLRLIGIILSTGGLKVNFVHPDSGKLVTLTRENYQDMYKKYANRIYSKPVDFEGDCQEKEDGSGTNHTSPVAPIVPTPVVTPVTTDGAVDQLVPVIVSTPAVEVTPETPVTDASKAAEFSMKPIVAPEEKPKNFQSNNKPYNQQNGGQRNQTTNQK